MDSYYIILFVIVFLVILPRIARRRRLVAIKQILKRKKQTKEHRIMNELAKRFIGQECIIYTITSNDGSVLGVCGLELSELYFLLSYPSEESGFGSMVTLLAPMSGDTLLLSHGMAGRLEETYLNTEIGRAHV